MTDKTFSVRSNAIRNARGVLGKEAKQGVHFTVSNENGVFSWAPVAEALPVETKIAAAESKPAETVSEAPKARRKVNIHRIKSKVRAKVAAKEAGRKAGRKALERVTEVSGKRLQMFRLISSPNGASLDSLSNRLGWQKHTVRGAVSTIGSQFKVRIKSFKDERRGRVYKVTSRKAATS